MFRTISVMGVLSAVLAMAACAASKSADPLSPTVAGPIPGVNITSPSIMQPSLGAKVAVDQPNPRFQFNNAPHSGPVGPIMYVIEVADGDSFGNKLAVWTVAEQSGQTHLDSPQDLPPIKQLFWRVRAADPTTLGPWSATQVFQTPAPIVLPPPPPPDVPPGPAPGDALSLGGVAVYNSPA